MTCYTIGEFARRTRLSPKALRIYGELGLVVPTRVDPDSGYRLYGEHQIQRARLVAMLRRLQMPLATIATVIELDDAAAARALSAWWAEVELTTAQRRELVAYLQVQLSGKVPAMYEIEQRALPERTVVSISRHLHGSETDAFFDQAFSQLRGLGTGLDGIAGAPYLIFYGEVSDDSDGPMELCRPVAAGPEQLVDRLTPGMQARREPAHEEAYVRLAMKDAGWPAMLPACDALERWVRERDRQPDGMLRQLLIADQRTAAPETPIIDLSVPLR